MVYIGPQRAVNDLRQASFFLSAVYFAELLYFARGETDIANSSV